MDTAEKKSFTRQMYTADSEVGKMKLQSVKENLYEATTKVVLYTVEMYTKMSLQEWVQTGLIAKLDKANKDLKREKDELEQGHIGMFDITNGCSVINDFVRKDALDISRVELNAKIEAQKNKQKEIFEKENILEQRKSQLENEDDESEKIAEEHTTEPEYFDGNKEEDDYLEDLDDNELDDDLDGDETDSEQELPSEIELFAQRVAAIKDIEELANIDEEIEEQKEAIEAQLKKLKSLTRDGQNLMAIQFDEEKESLENLRTLRNTVFAHKTEDLQEISMIGSWEPEAGPLYQWASEILKYIKVIEDRYRAYASFDEYYATKEGKDKFDGCKVYVQKQIKELYVNRSSIVFEFAGDLYDKEDEEYNFKKLIENMAISWDTGIRYLTVVTNEDLPELNVFFKECLSGTNKYVDYYLIDRNALRESCRKKDQDEKDYLYFKLLYHLNPLMETIYWRGKAFTKREFARQVLYKVIKVKNMFQLEGRLKDYEKYIEGIDVLKWCEYHLLSEVYFWGKDDIKGKKLALDMENAILDFYKHGANKGRTPLYRKAIKAAVNLYFFMGENYVFSYTRSNGQTFHWYSLEDACSYLENPRRFRSYAELSGFVDEMYKSDYFKIWRNKVKTDIKKKEV